jgi:hypothetical protein
VARKRVYFHRRAGLSALLEDSVCCGASGNGFIRGLGAGRESPRLTPGLARYTLSRMTFRTIGNYTGHDLCLFKPVTVATRTYATSGANEQYMVKDTARTSKISRELTHGESVTSLKSTYLV